MKLLDTTGVMPFTNIAKDKVLTAPSSPIKESIMVGRVEIGNSSGADASAGWGFQPADASWKAGQVSFDGTDTMDSYTEDTTDAQDAGTGDFALTTTTNDDGFAVQAATPFNVIGVTVSQAAAGGSPAYEYYYWNGSIWATLNVLSAFDPSGTGDKYVTFLAPHDWAAFTATDEPVATYGFTAGLYGVAVIAATAPSSTAALATKIWPVRLLDYIETVGDGQSVVRRYDHGMAKIPSGSSLVPYCSTADNANWITIDYTKSP